MKYRTIFALLLLLASSNLVAQTSLTTGVVYKSENTNEGNPADVTIADQRLVKLGITWSNIERPKINESFIRVNSNLEQGINDSTLKYKNELSINRLNDFDEQWLNNSGLTLSVKKDEYNPKDSFSGVGLNTQFVGRQNKNKIRFFVTSEEHNDFIVPYDVIKRGLNFKLNFNHEKQSPFWSLNGAFLNNHATDSIWSNEENKFGLSYNNWQFQNFQGSVALLYVKKQYEVGLPPPPPAGPPPPGPPPALPILSSSELRETRHILEIRLNKKLSQQLVVMWMSKFEQHKDNRADIDENEYRHELKLRWLF